MCKILKCVPSISTCKVEEKKYRVVMCRATTWIGNSNSIRFRTESFQTFSDPNVIRFRKFPIRKFRSKLDWNWNGLKISEIFRSESFRKLPNSFQSEYSEILVFYKFIYIFIHLSNIHIYNYKLKCIFNTINLLLSFMPLYLLIRVLKWQLLLKQDLGLQLFT